MYIFDGFSDEYSSNHQIVSNKMERCVSMDKDYIVEFDYFNNRDKVINTLARMVDEQDVNSLKMVQVFINNIPSSLECYVCFSYSPKATREIEQMKELIFSLGNYRPDLSLGKLIQGFSNRRFNSCSANDSVSVIAVLSQFYYQNKASIPNSNLSKGLIQRLSKAGYDAFEKLAGGTTIFFSHSSKQKQEFEEIIPYFTSVNELIWLDKYRIELNQDEETVRSEIVKGLNEASKVLFYITNDFMNSDWCNFELEMSTKLSQEKKNFSLCFIVEDAVKTTFFDNNQSLLNTIEKEKILLLAAEQKLENQIGKFVNQL
jgi:hypothetical protein